MVGESGKKRAPSGMLLEAQQHRPEIGQLDERMGNLITLGHSIPEKGMGLMTYESFDNGGHLKTVHLFGAIMPDPEGPIFSKIAYK